MCKNFTAALAVIGIALSGSACANTLNVNPSRLIEVIDVVDDSILGAAQKLDKMSIDSKEPVYILLNSPGGSTATGYSFADSMIAARERGTTLICVSGVLAASMAFNLLAYCDERYALAHTKLLFHPVRISSQEGLTITEIIVLAPQMRRMEERNRAALVEMMGVNKAWFDAHYAAETLWDAEDLVSQTPKKWLTIVDDVQGTNKLFMIEKPRSPFQFIVPGANDKRTSKPSLRYHRQGL